MDCEPVVADRAARLIEAARIECDQAVFTSIPSPMGRGYRIVAASAAVTADERREIIQRAPSHGALSSSDADATAMVSFGIAGGRHCVMASWHAEAEHTGRGGFRVHTQIALLDDKRFAAIGFDPFAVEQALRATREVALVADKRLPTLAFSPRAERSAPDIGELEHIGAIAAAVLDGQRVLVTRPLGSAAFAPLFDMLPAATRRGVTLCTGLRFAAARAMGVVHTPLRKVEIEQILHDHAYAIDDALPKLASGGPWADWLRLASRLIASGERQRLRAWTDRMDTPRTAESLGLLARAAAERDAIATMAESDLSALLARPTATSGDPLVLEQCRATADAARARLAVLQLQAAPASEVAEAVEVTLP